MKKIELVRAVRLMHKIGLIKKEMAYDYMTRILDSDEKGWTEGSAMEIEPVKEKIVVVQEPKVKAKKKYNKRFKKWTKAEIEKAFKKARTFVNKGYSERQAVIKACGHVTPIMRKKFSKWSRRKKLNEEHRYDRTKERMKYIQKRIKSLSGHADGMSYEKAFRQASQEWKQKKMQGEVKPLPDKMPVIFKKDDLNKLLFECLGNVVEKGGELKYQIEGQMFGLMDVKQWRDLIMKLVNHIPEICEYFGVKNKFKMKGESQQLVLSYGN